MTGLMGYLGVLFVTRGEIYGEVEGVDEAGGGGYSAAGDIESRPVVN